MIGNECVRFVKKFVTETGVSTVVEVPTGLYCESEEKKYDVIYCTMCGKIWCTNVSSDLWHGERCPVCGEGVLFYLTSEWYPSRISRSDVVVGVYSVKRLPVYCLAIGDFIEVLDVSELG